jgi:hypothetical protein
MTTKPASGDDYVDEDALRAPGDEKGGLTVTTEPASGIEWVVEDALQAPTEEFTLIITNRDPDAVDMAAQSVRESREPGIEEIVLLPAPLEVGLPGLMSIRTYIAQGIATEQRPSAVLVGVLEDLLAGQLRGATIDLDGKLLPIEPNRWRARDAMLVLRTGRLGDADVYIVTEPIAAGLAEAPVEVPAWSPGELETLKSWCCRADVEAAARARIKAAGGTPNEKAICRELCTMWRGAGKTTGTVGSIEQARLGGRGPR